MKVFISYNNKEKHIAQELKVLLDQNNIDAVIDTVNIKAGDKLAETINMLLKDVDAVIFIVSRNSLVSTWVGLESIRTIHADTKFLACYTDNDFLRVDFVRKARETLEEKIREIQQEINILIDKYSGIDHLGDDYQRHIDLYHNLPKIVAELKKRHCIDISSTALKESIGSILDALQVTPVIEEELLQWWEGLPDKWKTVFKKNYNADIVPTIGQLNDIINFESINCHGVKVISLDPLTKMRKLKVLFCADTWIDSLLPLAHLNELSFVDCSNTSVADLSPLLGLQQLKDVICINTKIDTENISLFKLKRNDCRISSKGVPDA